MGKCMCNIFDFQFKSLHDQVKEYAMSHACSSIPLISEQICRDVDFAVSLCTDLEV